MRYMLQLYVEARPAPGTPASAEAFAAIRRFHATCSERGVLVASGPLQAPETATTVRVRDGRTLTTDGPFAETTEWLGGYFVLECRDLDDALELAALCPTAAEGAVEIRAIAGH